MEPPVILVGVSRAAPLLRAEVTSLPSVAAARRILSPEHVLVISDTALAGAPIPVIDTLRHHAATGGRVIVIRGTSIESALTWDVPGAVEVVLPTTVAELARVIGVTYGADGPLEVDQATHYDVPPDEPIIAWKRGQLFLGPDGALLAAGAFAGALVPLSCDALPGTRGFYAFVERHTVENAFIGAAILTVRLSGHIERLGTPRSDGNQFVATRQEVIAVEFSVVCQRRCDRPATATALYRRAEGDELVVTCDEHAVGHRRLAPEDLQDLLGAHGVLWLPLQSSSWTM
jgi:hypothetical protein